mgnify:CR=1 FL=1
MRTLLRYIWGTIVRPAATFDALAQVHSLRWAVLVVSLPVLQVWGNIALHAALGLDWLGTRGILADPTLVGLFGHLRVDLAGFVPVFAALMPFLAFFGLAFYAGATQVVGRLWGGRGTFEQLVTPLAFATAVPNLVIGATSEWLFGVPIDLLTGQPYWWVSAMYGKLGPAAAAVWNIYVFGVYLAGQYLWIIALGSLAIRRIQRIPWWSAILTMLIVFASVFFIESFFVR